MSRYRSGMAAFDSWLFSPRVVKALLIPTIMVVIWLLLRTGGIAGGDGSGKCRLRLVPEHRSVGDVVKVRVILRTPMPLGAYDLEAMVDPSHGELLGIEGGSTEEFSPPPIVNDLTM